MNYIGETFEERGTEAYALELERKEDLKHEKYDSLFQTTYARIRELFSRNDTAAREELKQIFYEYQDNGYFISNQMFVNFYVLMDIYLAEMAADESHTILDCANSMEEFDTMCRELKAIFIRAEFTESENDALLLEYLCKKELTKTAILKIVYFINCDKNKIYRKLVEIYKHTDFEQNNPVKDINGESKPQTGKEKEAQNNENDDEPPKKICFIMCVNDDFDMQEACYYISRLNIPEGYEVEVLQVYEAKSMTGGYNEAMASTEAKYKIYLHQDVRILNRNFLQDLLEIFKDPKVGLVGMVGTPKMPENQIMWYAEEIGAAYIHNGYETRRIYNYQKGAEKRPKNYCEVEAIDGFLMATQYDLPWQEEHFTGWDFYDISQSYEFRNRSYKVVVPRQEEPWCLHDDGFLDLGNYYKTRRKFKEIYD